MAPQFDNASRPVPERDEIQRFVDVVFGYVDGLVVVRLIPEKGTPEGPITSSFPAADGRLANALEIQAKRAANGLKGCYVVPCTVASPGNGKKDNILETAVVLVDLDAGDVSAKRAHLAEHLGPPTLEVASGGRTDRDQPKLHLYWRLSEAARGEDLEVVARARAQIALKAGGDPSFARLSQPIRVAGSVHGKNGNKSAVRILSQSDRDYDLGELIASIEVMPRMTETGFCIDAGSGSGSCPGFEELMGRTIRANGLDGITRFEALSIVIGHWIRQVRIQRIALDEAREAVRKYNANNIQPPWEESRLHREFEAILRNDIRNGGPMPVRPNGTMRDEPEAPLLSDDALADLFIASRGVEWRYVDAWGTWLHWNGRVWERDQTQLVRNEIRMVCRGAAANAGSAAARRIASAKTIAAVERVAATDPRIAVSTDAWDAAGFRLNTTGGIIDLETGELLPHSPGSMMTQITNAAPGLGCPLWKDFLAEIMGGDDTLVAYLQRVCGYSLTASVEEQVFFFFHGSGANGKSVFIDTIATILGSYACSAPLETFVVSRGSSHPTDLAGLRGRRFVSVTETETGRAWAESRIKAVTGGDRIRARQLYRDFFDFTPTFKLLVAGNHRPRITGMNEAMRRRLHLVPFDVTIPEERRDKHLKQRLLQERDGILAWMIEGTAMWGRVGLAPPDRVRDAAAAYFDEEDDVSQWIAECCTVGCGLRSLTSHLFADWKDWAQANGVDIGTQRAFGEALETLGFPAFRSGKGRGRIGLGLERRAGEGKRT